MGRWGNTPPSCWRELEYLFSTVFERPVREKPPKVIDSLYLEEASEHERTRGHGSKYDGMTLEEVAEVLGVTKERVRQIETRALRKIRHPARARKLEPFLE